MIAKGGYSDQATSPKSMGLCAHALTSETWLPCLWTWTFFLPSPNTPILMKKRRNKLWGGSMSKAVLGRE